MTPIRRTLPRAAALGLLAGVALVAAAQTPPPVGRVIPPGRGEPAVLVFVRGSACPHCMGQLTALADRLAERKARVVVVSATDEADLRKFPPVPFALVADPGLKLFREYKAVDGDQPRHATIVRSAAGKEVFRKVGDEPYTDVAAILAVLEREAPRYRIAVNRTDETTDDYLTWGPTPCQIRIEGGAKDGPDVEVTLTNDDPATTPDGGDLRFADKLTPGTTATKETLTLKIKADGTPTDFVVAGWKAGRLTEASVKEGGRDAVIEVREGGAAGRVVGRAAAMVRVRKNYAEMNAVEKREFLRAFASLRDMDDVTKDRFEPLVRTHKFAAMGRVAGFDQAHISSGFLPWHRAFLLLFERELQRDFPHVALPYWRMDQPPAHFTPADLGNNYDPDTHATTHEVILASSNPLYGWRLRFDDLGRLVRNPGDHVQISAGANYLSGDTLNDQSAGLYARFRPLLEANPHNDGHNNTGAWMAACVTSPADPLFWVFHCHHDHLWAQWQRTFDRFDPTGTDPAHYFPNDAYSKDAPEPQRIRFPLGHHLKDTMWPWDGTKGRVIPGDRYSTRPDDKQGPFPKAPAAGLWPPAPATPTCADMIDYLGVKGGIPHGFAYDDTKFGAAPKRLVAAGPPAPRPGAGMFLDPGASERTRLDAGRDLLPADFAGPAALAAVLTDARTSAAVKARALTLLGQADPAAGAARAAGLAKGPDAVLAAEAARELVRLHESGRLPAAAQADAYKALQDLAESIRLPRPNSPQAQGVALEFLASHRDPGVAGLLKDLLEDHLKSPLPLRRVVALTRPFPQHFGLVRPLLERKQEELVVAALWALEGDKESLTRRLELAGSKTTDPGVRRAAMRSVMAEAPDALAVLLKVATDGGESDAVRSEAAAGARVSVRTHRRELGAKVGEAEAALAALRLPPGSELGRAVDLTLETIRGGKR